MSAVVVLVLLLAMAMAGGCMDQNQAVNSPTTILTKADNSPDAPKGGCPILSNNDKKYLQQFSSNSYMLVCQVLVSDLEKADKNSTLITAGTRRSAGACAKLISDGSYPDSEILRDSRARIISGYTKMANGDLIGGLSDYKDGNKNRLDYSISASLCTAS